ncbi:MAG TPA: hypothetical protein VMN99_07110, partial [Anaerolineales bacterium]|nr:hypothetical protein [Anaerolineales bacterium]
DICQFCQTPLKPDSVLRSGENPTKKNTGELETILPDWLRDVRQQARDSAEEDAAQAAAQPKVQKSEPPDLLAGLASQAGKANEEDIPDWLASINPTAKQQPSPSSAPDPDTDFFAQFSKSESKPELAGGTPPEDVPSFMGSMGDQSSALGDKDELSEWFTQASEQSEQIVEIDPDRGQNYSDLSGGLSTDSTPERESPPKQEEDLSWLYNLEAAAKQTGELQPPNQETDWKAGFEAPSTQSQSSTPQDDLSWLDRLGGIEEPARQEQMPEQSSKPQDDLSWLHQGEISEPSQTSQPAAPQEDLSWLNTVGATSEPQTSDAAPDQAISSQPSASEEDLDWLNKLGGTSEPVSTPQASNIVEHKQPSEPVAAQENPDWLNDLGGEPEPLSVPPFAETESGTGSTSPRQTAPLDKEARAQTEPDWLKSATEAPSMPAPGDLSMDWFSGSGQPPQEKTAPPTPQTAPFESDIISTPSEPAALSNQDVDSLFSAEMPDWLSRAEPETAEPVPQRAGIAPAEGVESLAPVDLPSWVQAMRPVETVISETAPSLEDQPAETEGPLAGLHGVLPIAPIGSSRRPKAVSLTLQVSEEQQTSVALLEQILGSETSPRALFSSSVVASQQWLRWALTGLFLVVLSIVIFTRSQIMPVSASLPNEAGGISNVVMSIPVGAKALVVIDYEPSLAGEMEAISGPLLDQIVLLSQPNLAFISTSPNGSALVERLMVNTRINQAGIQYANLGYLPGGSAGVLGFIEAPGQIVPLADIQSFSEYSVLVVLTDHAESGRVWVEQLQRRKQIDPALANQPLLMVASAQAGPLLQPYVSSRQITGMLSGLSDAARYEFVNNSRPGIARSYWDTFGIGLMMSVAVIVIGSLWSVVTGMRARRINAEQG